MDQHIHGSSINVAKSANTFVEICMVCKLFNVKEPATAEDWKVTFVCRKFDVDLRKGKSEITSGLWQG